MPGGLKQNLTIIISAQDKISGTAKSVEGRINAISAKIGDAAKKIGMAAIAITTAILGMAKQALAAFEKFDVAMRNVWTLLPKVADDGFRYLGQAVMDMSKTLPQTPDQLGASLYDIVSAGITETADSLMVLESATTAAVAGLTDAKTAARGAIAIMNSFGKSAADIPHIFDLMFSTVRVGVLTFQDVSDTVGRMASQFGGAGASMEEMLGSLAFLTRIGLNAQNATTRLSRALQSMVAESDKFKDFGAPVFDAAGKFRGMEVIIGDLRKQLAGLTTEDQLKKIQELTPNIRAAQAIQAMVLRYGLFKEMIDEVTNSHGAMQAAAKKQLESLSSKIQILKNNFQVFMIEVGGEVAKTLEPMVKELTEAMQKNAKEWRESVSLILRETIQGVRTITIEIAKGLGKLKRYAEVLGYIQGAGEGGGGRAGRTAALTEAQISKITGQISNLLGEKQWQKAVDLFEKWEKQLPVERTEAFALQILNARLRLTELFQMPPIKDIVPDPKDGFRLTNEDEDPAEQIGTALGRAAQAALDRYQDMQKNLRASLMTEREAIIDEYVEREDIIKAALKNRVITEEQYTQAILLAEKDLNKQLAELDKKRTDEFTQLWQSTLDRFAAGFADAAAAAIVSQESFTDAMRAMITDIKKVLISTLIEIAIKRLVTSALSGNIASILLIAGGAIAALNSMQHEAARPSTNQEGGYIQRSGMAMVHEGEQILPAGARTSRPGQGPGAAGYAAGSAAVQIVLRNPIFLDGKSGADALAREIKPALDRLGARNG